MLSGKALEDAIAVIITRPHGGTYFRATALRYAADPLGKKRPLVAAAQRFNRQGGSRILYLGDDHQSSMEEAIRGFSVPPRALTVVPVQVNLNALLDLRDPAVLTSLGTDASELARNFRPLNATGQEAPSQALGEACSSSGLIDGLLYPSLALSGSTCLAVIEKALQPLGSSLSVNDPHSGLVDRLP